MIKTVMSFRNEVRIVMSSGRAITQYLPSEQHAKQRVADILDGKYTIAD